MKVIVSEELISRLTNSATNGSIIAKDILAELMKNADASEIISGGANYFSTKRKKEFNQTHYKVKIVFTTCTKNLTNEHFPDKDNPQAAWFSENRADIEPSTFVKYFKNLPDYPKTDIDYFINSICVNSKVTVKLYDKMSDFYDAYLGENYIGIAQYGTSSLHGSCMKDDDTSRNAADFYRNFAGAKIIVAKDAEKNILGRAIVWKNVNCEDSEGWKITTVSVLDRIYFSHDFIIKLIRDYAQSIGIHLRKKRNDHTSADEFVTLNYVHELKLLEGDDFKSSYLTIKVPASQWHKKGAPYLDTFYTVSLFEDGKLYLQNTDYDSSNGSKHIALCRHTGGYATQKRNVCPVCGLVFAYYNAEKLCKDCHEKYSHLTPFGDILIGKPINYKGNTYPDFMFFRGKPNANLKLYLQIEKLYVKDNS